MSQNITVFGGGSFGTALSTVLARNGHTIVILTRNKAVVDSINNSHKNCNYFSDVELPTNITATSDAKEALTNCNYILHCIPVQQSLEYLQDIKEFISPNIPIISTSKGLHKDKLWNMSDLVPQALGRAQPLVTLSGPSFAKELMEKISPTAVVAASTDMALAEATQKIFTSTSFRCYTSTDVVGVELGGALKNVFAIAGIVDGLGGCYEMTRLAIALGAKPHTLYGLSGVGDLMLTCFGSLSRNRTVGQRLGRGETIGAILASMSEVAEGVATSHAAVKLSERCGLQLPIISGVAAILSGTVSPVDAVKSLMLLPVGEENQLFKQPNS